MSQRQGPTTVATPMHALKLRDIAREKKNGVVSGDALQKRQLARASRKPGSNRRISLETTMLTLIEIFGAVDANQQRDFQRARRIEGGQMIAPTRKNWKRSDRRRKTKAQRVARRANRSPK